MNQKSHLQRKVLPQKKAAEVEGAEREDQANAALLRAGPFGPQLVAAFEPRPCRGPDEVQ